MDSQEIKQIDNEKINSGLSFKAQMNRLKFSYFGHIIHQIYLSGEGSNADEEERWIDSVIVMMSVLLKS